MNQRFLGMILACIAFVFVMERWIGPSLGLVKEVPIEEAVEAQPNELDQEIQQAKQLAVEAEPLAPEPVSAEIDQETIAAREVILENPNIRVRFDNRGGVIREVVLKQFKTSKKSTESIRVVTPTPWAPGEVVLSGGARTKDWMFHVKHASERQLVFERRLGETRISKTFDLDDRYGLRIKFEIDGPQVQGGHLVVADGLQPMNGKDFDTPSLLSFGAMNPKLMEVVWYVDGDRDERAAAKIENGQFQPLLEKSEFIHWFGISDSFFGNVFRPDQPVGQLALLSQPLENAQREEERLPVVAMPLDNLIEGQFYFGPKQEKELAAIADDMPDLVDYGMAGFLSKILYKLLAALHGLTGNWGWAIVILTAFIRMALLPMTIPSVKSSFRMRKLQPKLDALKKKYSGSDLESKQKMQQEQFALYKTEGINPFSSCIIMIPQIPIFIAYFSLLRTAIDLRQSEWMFWINDLSVKDHTYILPIIMGATMFLTQLTMPMPGDPAQQKMMRFMPLMMTVMFVAMPSGLILYMITSNFFQLGQTMVMKWRYEKA